LTNFFISLKNLSAIQTPAFQQQIRIIHYIYVQNVSSYTIYKKKLPSRWSVPANNQQARTILFGDLCRTFRKT